MSDPGGYYKYRCKYWSKHECQNWVWVNNAPCADCLAGGRDAKLTMGSFFRMSREVYIPQFENGFLLYRSTEVIATSDLDIGWAVRVLPAQLFGKTAEAAAMHGIAAKAIIDT